MNASPLNIEIKTINLNNKKLTKSIFNQIEPKICFDENLDFIGDQFFGYIRDKDRKYLIWSREEKLRKSDLSRYYDLRQIELQKNSTRDEIGWLLKKCNIEFDHHIYSGEGQYELDYDAVLKYNGLVDKVREFITELSNYQLFI